MRYVINAIIPPPATNVTKPISTPVQLNGGSEITLASTTGTGVHVGAGRANVIVGNGAGVWVGTTVGVLVRVGVLVAGGVAVGVSVGSRVAMI